MSAAVTQSKPNGIPTPAELGFNPAELRQKYAEEREKRLRADGNNQYQEITGEHAHYNADPYVEPGFTRPALHEELDVVIVGGAAAEGGDHQPAYYREGRGFWRDLVLEPLSRRPV